ncbi:MAG TPA: 50S ribosomal protein L4, partial [Clostridiales bacterium]|nr:50S ribosomal protein L4 [Clostridiales bacterium]
NLPGVTTTTATILSPYEILNNRALVIDKSALQKIEEVFA